MCITRLIERSECQRNKIENFHINFLNSNFSVDIASIGSELFGYVPHSPPEGSVSQNIDLGPGYFFMLCRNFIK